MEHTLEGPLFGRPTLLASNHHYWDSLLYIIIEKELFICVTRYPWYTVFYEWAIILKSGLFIVILFAASIDGFSSMINLFAVCISKFQNNEISWLVLMKGNICKVDFLKFCFNKIDFKIIRLHFNINMFFLCLITDVIICYGD